ncbi:MAG: hypothetical protein HY774_23575 [Acidobacteria bacterium]|nr:hypothetical protein [Acidobacteriota bacterium]
MSSKPSKPLVTERSCPKCEARITFPDDVKTVLCPKCRQSLRVFREDGKLHLREPDRKDDLAQVQSELDQIDLEMTVLLEKVAQMERSSFALIGFSIVPFGVVLYALKEALHPKGDWTFFGIALVVFLGCLGGAYWVAFNPPANRKIMKLMEDRITLRRRMEAL